MYRKDHELNEAYGLYQLCVGRQIAQVETHDTRYTKSFPTGLIHLPYQGGVMDQPNVLMEYFECFLSSEREAFFSNG